MGNPIWVYTDFSIATLQARNEKHNILKVLKGENLQSIIFYLVSLSFRTEEEKKTKVQRSSLPLIHRDTSGQYSFHAKSPGTTLPPSPACNHFIFSCPTRALSVQRAPGLHSVPQLQLRPSPQGTTNTECPRNSRQHQSQLQPASQNHSEISVYTANNHIQDHSFREVLVPSNSQKHRKTSKMRQEYARMREQDKKN